MTAILRRKFARARLVRWSCCSCSSSRHFTTTVLGFLTQLFCFSVCKSRLINNPSPSNSNRLPLFDPFVRSLPYVDGTGALAFVAGVLSLLGMGVLVFYTVSVCPISLHNRLLFLSCFISALTLQLTQYTNRRLDFRCYHCT